MKKSMKPYSLDYLFITMLILISVVVQIIFINPPTLSDQMQYYFTATNFPHLPADPSHWSMRIGLILPVTALFWIFGHAEITYYFFPVISMALLVVGMYVLGSNLFNRRVGFVSALWMMFMPDILLQSGNLLPDLPATACIVGGFALLIASNKVQNKKWVLLLVGILFGWSYLIKEYFIIFVVLVPLIFWIYEIPFRHLVTVGLGAILMFGIEVLYGIRYYHTPFVRFRTANPRETIGHIDRNVKIIFTYLPNLLSKRKGEGTTILAGLAVIDMITQSVKKKKAQIFLLSWVVLAYCFFTALGLLPVIFSWEDRVLLRLYQFRYWIPIIPPFLIAGVAVIDQWGTKFLQMIRTNERLIQPAITLLLIFMLSITSIRGITDVKNDPVIIRGGGDHYLELREFLKETSSPDEIIWIVRDMKIGYDRILPMYTNNFWGRKIWDGTFKYLNTGRQFIKEEDVKDGYVIIDRFYYNQEYSPIPSYMENIPEDWELTFESENKRIALYYAK